MIWIWILITILSDLFRDHELSGWGKAAWVLFLVFIPFLTALIYLIARGNGMRTERSKPKPTRKSISTNTSASRRTPAPRPTSCTSSPS